MRERERGGRERVETREMKRECMNMNKEISDDLVREIVNLEPGPR